MLMGSAVEPIVVIPATDKVLRRDGPTVTLAVVAEAVPPGPVHVNVYVTVPAAVGAIVAEPLVDWVPVNAPPIVLEVVAVHDVALVDVHASCTARPKLTVVAWAGEVNATVGIGIGAGAAIGGAL
jgi:hypothetical protein